MMENVRMESGDGEWRGEYRVDVRVKVYKKGPFFKSQ